MSNPKRNLNTKRPPRYGGLKAVGKTGCVLSKLSAGELYGGLRGCIEAMRLVSQESLGGEDQRDHKVMLDRMVELLAEMENRDRRGDA